MTHTVSMKRQYRAVTALDYRTLALATDSKKSANNVIVIVRFDSSEYRSFTNIKTIGARQGSLPIIRLLSKTLFKVRVAVFFFTSLSLLMLLLLV